jgi:hypothetical protein
MMLNTKSKVILSVFGFIVIVFVIMFFMEKSSSNKRMENFADDEDEEEFEPLPEETKKEKEKVPAKEAPKETSKPEHKVEATKDTDTTESGSFNPVTFVTNYANDMMKKLNVSPDKAKDTFKELFSGDTLQEIVESKTPEQVKSIFAEVMKTVAGTTPAISQFENTSPSLNANGMLTSKIQAIKEHLKGIEQELNSIPAQQAGTSTTVPVDLRMSNQSKAPTTASSSKLGIEGFENVPSYALY